MTTSCFLQSILTEILVKIELFCSNIFLPNGNLFRSVRFHIVRDIKIKFLCRIDQYNKNCDFSYAFSESWCDLAITVYVALFITSKWDYPCITWDFRIWSYQSETLTYKFCIAYNHEKESSQSKFDLTWPGNRVYCGWVFKAC